MHTLIVTTHPDPHALTLQVADNIATGFSNSGSSVELVNLHAEGFDPRFNEKDVAAFRRHQPIPTEIVTEQARLDRADALVLVYPVYWWSMPALMKGWIDRVFTHGWAYDDRPDGGVIKKLAHLRVHLVALGGADLKTWARHGYYGAMRTQIDHGIFGYCGAPVVSSELLTPPQGEGVAPWLEEMQALGRKMAAR